MQKKLLLLLLFTSPLFTASNDTQKSYQSNDKCIELLEKQIDLQTKSYEMQSFFLEIELLKLKEKQTQEEQRALALKIEAEKAWYQKTWDLLAPSVKDAVLRLIIASITGKIINSSISILDHATGDFLVQNGYDKFAVYAGTFIAEQSIHEYLQKRETKKTYANPEVQNYLATLKNIRAEYSTDIAKGEIFSQGLDLRKKAQAGKAADDFLRRQADSTENQANYQYWRNTEIQISKK